jgi:unsaturated rhamnogalacturonyl hydrolase
MKKLFSILSFVVVVQVVAQTPGERVAQTAMLVWKDSLFTKWSYDLGVILKGMEGNWYRTGDPKYFQYIQKQMDFFVQNDGTIRTYKKDEFNIDHINNGKLLLFLYRVTEKEKYWKAAQLLRQQLREHPRTNEGGFWHKKVYPNQMWLDGLYMGQPFYAEYAMLTNDDSAFNDIANQFSWMENHARDTKTGLLYHGWDESKQQQWANKTTGTSPLFWARAMGWYATALVDVLEYYPTNHPKRKKLIAILNRLINAVEKQQDATTGLWLDILNYDGPNKEKNYFEASASSQFVYAIAKGIRLGVVPSSKLNIAKNGYNGLVKTFVKEDNGQTNLYGTVKVSGLGGKPYRDGSFDYYMSEPVIVNDPKGVGAFILAANEIDLLSVPNLGNQKTVLLDDYFNHETKKDIAGNQISWHYKWNEKNNGGFYFLGNLYNQYGYKTATLSAAPTKKNLKKSAIYIIVDADNNKENPTPNFVDENNVQAIAKWVKAGGLLVLLHNDKGNAEFEKFNKLSNTFGIHFNEDSRNRVEENKFEMGAVAIDTTNEVLQGVQKIYIKEISTLKLSGNAKSVLQENGDVIAAIAKYGKGTVFAIGDPWLYNEYVDGRKLPTDFENFRAAKKLIEWISNQISKQ